MSLKQLSCLLPLPESDLEQMLQYATTLSKDDAANHFKELLGETPQSIEFITSFNSQRPEPPSSSTASSAATRTPPSRGPKQKKKKLHTPPPRQIQDSGTPPGVAYRKKGQEDYIAEKSVQNVSALAAIPVGVQAPRRRGPPSAAGALISDFKPLQTPSPIVRSDLISKAKPRSASPLPKIKVNLTGGTAMHGQSSIINDLDSAIQALEISTNPSLDINDVKRRQCNCIATRHPLLTAAPNCLNCGKVICVKEGLGPCSFCGTPLLTQDEIQGMIRELREERGRERTLEHNASHRRAEVSKSPAPFSNISAEAEEKAKHHRDKLLSFQAANARRTRVHDEVADFEVPINGQSIWASPQERAMQLKKQQKILREQEWNARPEYEKRRQVVSIDLVRGKVFKRMEAVERPKDDSEGEETREAVTEPVPATERGSSTNNKNPLMGGLTKPVWNCKGIGVEKDAAERKPKMWRRVQDDNDNESTIFDGGIHGGRAGSKGGDFSIT